MKMMIVVLAGIITVGTARAELRFWETGLHFGQRSATVSNLVPLDDPGRGLKVDPQAAMDLYFRMNFDAAFSHLSLNMKNFGAYMTFLKDPKETPWETSSIDGAPGASFIYPFNMLWTVKGLFGSEIGKDLYLLGGLIYRAWELQYAVEIAGDGEDYSLGDWLFAVGPGVGLGRTFFNNSLRLGAVWYHSWGWYATTNEIDSYVEYDLGSNLVLRAGYNMLDANGLATDPGREGADLENDAARQASEAFIRHIYAGIHVMWGDEAD